MERTCTKYKQTLLNPSATLQQKRDSLSGLHKACSAQKQNEELFKRTRLETWGDCCLEKQKYESEQYRLPAVPNDEITRIAQKQEQERLAEQKKKEEALLKQKALEKKVFEAEQKKRKQEEEDRKHKEKVSGFKSRLEQLRPKTKEQQEKEFLAQLDEWLVPKAKGPVHKKSKRRSHSKHKSKPKHRHSSSTKKNRKHRKTHTKKHPKKHHKKHSRRKNTTSKRR